MKTPILSASGLEIGYAEGRSVPSIVASDLSVSLYPGEFVCLLGPNGSGKSTLIRALSGLDNPLAGKIQFEGRDLASMTPLERARQISVVLTDPFPGAMLPVYGLVALGRHPYTGLMGTLSATDKEKVDWALEVLGIEDLAAKLCSEVSDGERQKALIARALAQEARILLLDEPTAFVDLPRRVEIVGVLRELATELGIAILCSSHDLELSLRTADRILLMDKEGRIKAGCPEDLAWRGDFDKVFGDGKIVWDAKQGGFRIRRQTTRYASIEGHGEALIWTRRALARKGYELVADSREAVLEIVTGTAESGRPELRARMGATWNEFDTLAKLLEWLAENR